MRQIKTEIEIRASTERIWELLLNFENYPQWNTFIRSISGNSAVGSRLKLVIVSPLNNSTNTFYPVITQNFENEHFAWNRKLYGHMGILFTATHKFTLRPISDTRTLFVHEEESLVCYFHFCGAK